MPTEVLTDRNVREQDLIACLQVDERRIGDSIVGRDRTIAIWQRLIQSRSFVGRAVEAGSPVSGRRIVAFGCSVFVSSQFARAELSDPQPSLNDRLIARMDAGEAVVLSEAEVRFENSRGTLCLVVLYSNWVESGITEEQIFEVQSLFARRWFDAYCGYRFEVLISEEIGQANRAYRKATGSWRLVRDFPDQDRGLTCLTREAALSVAGSVAQRLFLIPNPTLRLRAEDQDLLLAAMNGATDADLAKNLHLTVASVKKRWRSIWDRVAEARPELLPESPRSRLAATRGPQKKHVLLAFIRDHPEELRPFDWTVQDQAKGRSQAARYQAE